MIPIGSEDEGGVQCPLVRSASSAAPASRAARTFSSPATVGLTSQPVANGDSEADGGTVVGSQAVMACGDAAEMRGELRKLRVPQPEPIHRLIQAR